jgi:LmbE family N-acetylglucosaminyl deacetylase
VPAPRAYDAPVTDTDARLDALFDRLARLREDELTTLSARDERPPADRRRARAAARAALGGSRRTDLEIAEEMLRAWATSVETSVPSGIFGTTGNARQTEARAQALPIVADAVLAILASDSLDPQDREVLTDSVLARDLGVG